MLWPFSKIIADFCLALMPCLSIGYWLNSVARYEFHVVEWALNPARMWLVVSNMFVPLLHQCRGFSSQSSLSPAGLQSGWLTSLLLSHSLHSTSHDGLFNCKEKSTRGFSRKVCAFLMFQKKNGLCKIYVKSFYIITNLLCISALIDVWAVKT